MLSIQEGWLCGCADGVMALLGEMGCANSSLVLVKTDQDRSIVVFVNRARRVSELASRPSSEPFLLTLRRTEASRRVGRGPGGHDTWSINIDSNHKTISGIAECAANFLNRYEVGNDGKTGYERTRGKR